MTASERAEQRRLATLASSRIRGERKQVRLALRDGTITLRAALRASCVQKLRVEQVVKWLPGVGKRKLPQLLASVNVSGTRVIGTLTPREQEALAGAEW